MKVRAIRPTRTQALVAGVTVVIGLAAVVAGALARWAVALALVVALLVALVALMLLTGRQIGMRINHQARVLNRRLNQLSEVGGLDVPWSGRPGPVAADASEQDADSDGDGGSRLSALDHWARTLLGSTAGRERFLQRAKRTRSMAARDLLAHSATRGRYRYDDLATVMESWRHDRAYRVPREEAKRLRLPSALTLARLLYSQRTSDRDLVNALTLYDVVVRATSLGRLSDIDRSHYADLCVDQGRFDRAREILQVRDADTPARASAHRFFAANAANPHLGSPGTDETAWLDQVNAVLSAGGFEPVTLAAGTEEPFYRLSCNTAPASSAGPLVSVLMPVYEPDAATDKAIDSILRQSHHNLELIVVDDGSPRVDSEGRATGVVEQLQRWAEQDDRITLILNEENHGAYWVRNQAYDEAQGDYVTIADKDDWHHPQQIEWQVRDLEEHRDRIANMVNWVRVNPLLRFLVRWGPDRVVHPSFASIMFRRPEVKQRLGYWDTVRKGADNEFRFRLQQTYGFRLNPTEPTPLIFSLMGDSNLTSTDLGLGFEHEDRGTYSHAYRRWHKELAARSSSYLERHPADRPFPAPGGILPERIRGGHFDIVYVVELDSPDRRGRQVREEISAAVTAGLHVGVVPAENFLSSGRAHLELDEGIEAMIDSGQVSRVATANPATADLLVVRPPSLFQICRDAPAGLRPARVVVVSDELPTTRRPARYNYQVHTVSEHVQTVFGVDPLWMATTEPIQQRLTRLLLRDQLSLSLWAGPSSNASVPATAVPATPRLLVGGFGSEETAGWLKELTLPPDPSSSDPGDRVLVAGGTWGSADLAEESGELAQLDVWVCLTEQAEPEAEQLTTAAMGHGALLVLSPCYQPAFGDSAVYAATPDEARDVLVGATARLVQPDTDPSPGEGDLAVESPPPATAGDGYLQQLRTVGLEAEQDAEPLWKE